MTSGRTGTVNTVLGPVPATELGIALVHEALLSVVPGAEYAYDVTLDRAEIFESLAAELSAYRELGGGTIVDSTGMFHGRDVPLLEALSRATGVHIVASTGMGPEEMLGGYFLTPQTNPPTPWPAEKFADLFAAEVTEGMVVPRVERRGSAGMITTTASAGGMTPTDESLFRGAARAALSTGAPLSIRFGRDAVREFEVVLDEGLPADRVVVGGMDRVDAVASGAPLDLARRGAYVAFDHIGDADERYVTNAQRVELVTGAAHEGLAERVLLSGNVTGVAKGHARDERTYAQVLTEFVPALESAGLDDAEIATILVANPARLLAVS